MFLGHLKDVQRGRPYQQAARTENRVYFAGFGSALQRYDLTTCSAFIGTFAEGAIQDLVGSGQIRTDDDYWTEGMPGWQKVSVNPSWR